MSSYGFLFDRRYCSRNLLVEWGVPTSADDSTTCVRRLGRPEKNTQSALGVDHVTGTRMSQVKAHEVLLSYSGDAVYLYNTQDEPSSQAKKRYPSTLAPNVHPKRRRRGSRPSVEPTEETFIDMHEADNERLLSDAESTSRSSSPIQVDHEERDTDSSEDGMGSDSSSKTGLPVILPRMRYAGACNVETVKDVNFLGRFNELIASGSDDGNVFIWSKKTGELLNILEGDDTVVNVIEENPRFQCCAVSGIDHSVKIFCPSKLPSKFSRISEEESIMEANAKQARTVELQRERFLQLVAQYRRAGGDDDGSDDEEGGAQCVYQ